MVIQQQAMTNYFENRHLFLKGAINVIIFCYFYPTDQILFNYFSFTDGEEMKKR